MVPRLSTVGVTCVCLLLMTRPSIARFNPAQDQAQPSGSAELVATGTLHSRNPSALTEGASLVFFTNILVLGDHVVVQEIGNVDAADRTTSQIAQLANERPLQQRVSAADLIIIGQVLS